MVVAFPGSALLLAAVEIYGVVAYSVAQRRNEIGIRIALGADIRQVRALLFRQTFRMFGAGIVVDCPRQRC